MGKGVDGHVLGEFYGSSVGEEVVAPVIVDGGEVRQEERFVPQGHGGNPS